MPSLYLQINIKILLRMYLLCTEIQKDLTTFNNTLADMNIFQISRRDTYIDYFVCMQINIPTHIHMYVCLNIRDICTYICQLTIDVLLRSID